MFLISFIINKILYLPLTNKKQIDNDNNLSAALIATKCSHLLKSEHFLLSMRYI